MTGNKFFPRLSFVNGQVLVLVGVESLSLEVFDLDLTTGHLTHLQTRPLGGPNAFKWGWVSPGVAVFGVGSVAHQYDRATDTVTAIGPALIGANHARDGLVVAAAGGLLRVTVPDGSVKERPAAGLWDTRDGYVFFPADPSNTVTLRWHPASGRLDTFTHAGCYALKAGPAGSAIIVADRVRDLETGRELNAAPWSWEGANCSWLGQDGRAWIATCNNALPAILLRPSDDPTNVLRLPPGAEDLDVIEVGDCLVVASSITIGGGQAELTVQTVRRDAPRGPLVLDTPPVRLPDWPETLPAILVGCLSGDPGLPGTIGTADSDKAVVIEGYRQADGARWTKTNEERQRQRLIYLDWHESHAKEAMLANAKADQDAHGGTIVSYFDANRVAFLPADMEQLRALKADGRAVALGLRLYPSGQTPEEAHNNVVSDILMFRDEFPTLVLFTSGYKQAWTVTDARTSMRYAARLAATYPQVKALIFSRRPPYLPELDADMVACCALAPVADVDRLFPRWTAPVAPPVVVVPPVVQPPSVPPVVAPPPVTSWPGRITDAEIERRRKEREVMGKP